MRWRSFPGISTTVGSSVSLWATNILAFSPLLLSASFSRREATAAPPARSLVLIISTFMLYPDLSNKGNAKNGTAKAERIK